MIPVALHSVAHTVSWQILAFLEMSRGSLTPQEKTLAHPSCHPPPVTVSHGNFPAKTDRATQGCSSYTHTDRARGVAVPMDTWSRQQVYLANLREKSDLKRRSRTKTIYKLVPMYVCAMTISQLDKTLSQDPVSDSS